MPNSNAEETGWGIELVITPVVAALAVAAVRWSDYLSLTPAQQKPAVILYAAFQGFLAGLLLDLAVFILKSNQAKLRTLLTKLTEISRGMEVAQVEIKAAAASAGNLLEAHRHIQDVLASDKFNGEFARIILTSAIENFWSIPDAKRQQYCHYLKQGILHCTVWEGIHQGSVREFTSPGSNIDASYLQELNESSRIRPRRRIIILTEAQVFDDISNLRVMEDFWRCTGEKVESFYIKEDAAYNFMRSEAQLAQFDAPLHDCALYDRSWLLHYDKSEQRIEFAIEDSYDRANRVRAVKTLFKALDDERKAPRANRFFTEITREMCVR